MSLPTHAYPGLPLGPSTKYLPGPGTHLQNNNTTIIASIPGTPTLTPPARNSQPSLPTLSITPKTQTPRAPLSRSVVRASALPAVGSTVLARVTRLERARASVAILVVDNSDNNRTQTAGQTAAHTATATSTQASPDTAGMGGTVIAEALTGVIRREDVRGWEVDKVVVAEAFRVGDIVRAVVISIGDQAAYYLSTARNELGVLVARSEGSGSVMVPVSWKEFRDARTGRAERRKVAKPV